MVLAAVILSGIGYAVLFGDKNLCEHIKEVRLMTLTGVLHEKIDQTWNHNHHAIVVLSNNKEEYINLTSDANRQGSQSKLWQSLVEGDSIRKFSGEFLVWYKKPNGKWTKEKIDLDDPSCKQ